MAESHDAAATSIIRSLTGGRFSWPPVRVREVYPLKTDRIRLVGRPIRAIVRVLDRATGEELEYERRGRYLLFSSCSAREIDVTYEYGSEPPALVARAIGVLSAELVLAEAGDAACRLPDRVVSISRQGVSYSFESPTEILTNGRTGVYEVDLALASYRGTKPVRRRARVFSPEYPPPDRLEVSVLNPDVDLVITRGTTWSKGWLVKYQGVPIDETWQARSQIRVDRDDTSTLLHEFAVGVNPDGTVVLGADASESELWDWSFGYFDVEVESPDHVEFRPISGTVRTRSGVTQ